MEVMRFLISAFALLFSFHALRAQESPETRVLHFIALISTDYAKKTYSLFIETNAKNEITSIKTRNNLKNKIKTYPADILHKEITLVKAVGISLVTLRCHDFNPLSGCPITIEYPSNVAFGHFKKFQAEIKKGDAGSWGLYAGGQFTELRLMAKKALGLLIGIKRIEPRLLTAGARIHERSVPRQTHTP